MTNEHYLVVSYFLVSFVSLGLGVVVYRVLRTPFAAIAELVAGKFRATILKRALSVSLAMAAVLGFLSVSYTCGMNYEQVVKDRDYMVQVNREQLQGAGNWIVYVVLGWGFVVAICLAVLRTKKPERNDQP